MKPDKVDYCLYKVNVRYEGEAVVKVPFNLGSYDRSMKAEQIVENHLSDMIVSGDLDIYSKRILKMSDIPAGWLDSSPFSSRGGNLTTTCKQLFEPIEKARLRVEAWEENDKKQSKFGFPYLRLPIITF